jgi:hypothetical protein
LSSNALILRPSLKRAGTQNEGQGTTWNNWPQLVTQAKIRMYNIPNAKRKGSLRHMFDIRLKKNKNRRPNRTGFWYTSCRGQKKDWDRCLISLLHETEKGLTRKGVWYPSCTRQKKD